MKNKKKGVLIAVAVAVIVVIAVAAVCLNRKTELSAKAGQSRLIKQKNRIKLTKKNQRVQEIQMRRL